MKLPETPIAKDLFELVVRARALKAILIPYQITQEKLTVLEQLGTSRMKNDSVAARRWKLWGVLADPDWTGLDAADPPSDGITMAFVAKA
jgi:hypothetical protein